MSTSSNSTPSNIYEHLAPEDLQSTANLQLFASQVVEGMCTGLHRSPHKGFSVEFRQHRQYARGDEIRRLDWKVFGKTDRFYIREYEEETNLRATLLLDCSGSMGYGGEHSGSHQSLTKFQYATRLAACLAYLLMKQQDSVGLATFDDKVRTVIPPRSRPSHLRKIFEEMAAGQTGGESELGGVFKQLVPKLDRRSLLVVISDCFCRTDELMQALAQFRHARHEVVIFQVLDPDELDFPFDKWTRFDCLERASVQQLVDPSHLRAAYLENLRRFQNELRDGCNRRRIVLSELTTREPFGDALARFLALRARRQRRRR